jgi:hypothetical protein
LPDKFRFRAFAVIVNDVVADVADAYGLDEAMVAYTEHVPVSTNATSPEELLMVHTLSVLEKKVIVPPVATVVPSLCNTGLAVIVGGDALKRYEATLPDKFKVRGVPSLTVTVTTEDTAALYVASPSSTASRVQVPAVDVVVRVDPEIEHVRVPVSTVYVVVPAELSGVSAVVRAAVLLTDMVAEPSESLSTASVTVRKLLPVVKLFISP